MKMLISFLKQRETLLGIAAAIAFQLIFVTVWLTAYDGIYERMDQFKVGIVSEDSYIGDELASGLEHENLFHVKAFSHMNVAEEQLDQRDINMLIHLPQTMSEQLQTDQQTAINYYINQSAPTLTKQMMENIADNINREVNIHVKEMMNEQMVSNSSTIFATQFEDEKIAKQVMTQIEMILTSSQEETVQSNIIKTNDQEGFAETMIPLLIVLASYIGAMLISQHLQLSEAKLINNFTKSSLFIGRQMINIILAITISLLTISLMYVFQVELNNNFFNLWGLQALLMFSFLALSQLFVMIFGNIGMIFNIALTAVQLVSSGAIVPRELLSNIYQSIGNFLPATYGVNSYFSLIYGGGDLTSDINHLLIIISILLIFAICSQLLHSLFTRTTPTVKS